MSFFANLAARINNDPEEQRKLIRARQAQVLEERYYKTAQHQWVLDLATKLGVKVFPFIFVEKDNSALTATYDFYVTEESWFQISFTWEENNFVSLIIYDRRGHHYWEPDDLGELLEYIVNAYQNPKTLESVLAG